MRCFPSIKTLHDDKGHSALAFAWKFSDWEYPQTVDEVMGKYSHIDLCFGA